MKPTDNLHQLIKSLTSSEKRYFKVFAKRHVVGAQNKYEQLFDTYDSLPDDQYDEAELKQKLKKKNLGKNLADDKKNLQEMVMRAMLNFHSGSSVDTQLNDLLAEEDFYRQKRLNDLRRKTIIKAKEIAEKYEKYTVLLTLIDREINMKVELNQDELVELAENLDKEKSIVLAKLNTIAVLRNTNQWFFIHFRLNANNLSERFWKEADDKLKNPVVKDYKPGLCFYADVNYYKTLAMYYQMKKDFYKHNNYTHLLYDCYETLYPIQKINDRVSYKIALYNYLNSLHQINDYETMGRLLEYAHTIEAISEDEEGEDFQNITLYNQLYYMNTIQFDKAIALVDRINKGMVSYRRKVNKARELTIYYNIAVSYLILERWNEVIEYTERIIADKTDVKLDLKHRSMLFKLLAYYEIDSHVLLLSQIRNIERALKKKSAFHIEETAFVKLLNQLLKNGKTFFQNTTIGADTFSKNRELQLWLQSRTNKTSILQIVKTR